MWLIIRDVLIIIFFYFFHSPSSPWVLSRINCRTWHQLNSEFSHNNTRKTLYVCCFYRKEWLFIMGYSHCKSTGKEHKNIIFFSCKALSKMYGWHSWFNLCHYYAMNTTKSDREMCVLVSVLGRPAVAGGLHACGPVHCAAEGQLQLAVDHQPPQQDEPDRDVTLWGWILHYSLLVHAKVT